MQDAFYFKDEAAFIMFILTNKIILLLWVGTMSKLSLRGPKCQEKALCVCGNLFLFVLIYFIFFLLNSSHFLSK